MNACGVASMMRVTIGENIPNSKASSATIIPEDVVLVRFAAANDYCVDRTGETGRCRADQSRRQGSDAAHYCDHVDGRLMAGRLEYCEALCILSRQHGDGER